ncbi:MAG: hypothetical protein AN481_04130 [Aphanizomenon flos-aquae LD13]|jgi:hypothetical protein|uniref:Uncharacterized protein n=1 Tax=Aphanizomenon flos-aquae LD13 TaxID=1710894 RepID=A0A1B7W062_APHFL|nr:hypothetical protein [Aphanizomenon flos-aquae UKL13-PB]MBO1062505.1 hypothetical protein [Aphanizomenon flos-aquae CP01]OBQ26597.1 MAG: hypothetical protein AN481_04130 [Aphanizomenon flos-aquae LD13]HCQ23210.1 hypothetical protein [Anabaena sp. UBA12330]
MKIKLSHNVKQRHYIEDVPLNQPKNFNAEQELTIKSQNIKKLTNGNWQFCYSDSKQHQQLTYPFHITQDEIKNKTTTEILCLSVVESEFEELIKIQSIKELIDSEKVVIYLYSSNTTCQPLYFYQNFKAYYQKLCLQE